jgi:hypothetical protein
LLILSGKDFEFLTTERLKKLAILLLRMEEIADAPEMPPAWPD